MWKPYAGLRLADALHHAHEQGMLHLDIKPSNVLVAGDGQLLLLDFHLARPPLAQGMAPPGWFGGTPGYMPADNGWPLKAVRALPIPRRWTAAQTFILSASFCSRYWAASRLLASKNRAVRRTNREVSPGLADVIAKCIDPNPSRRYQDAGELADDLRRHLAHQPLHSVPNRSPLERWRKCRRRQPLALARAGCPALAILAAAGVMGAAYYDNQYQQAEAALKEGNDLLQRDLPVEAENSLEHGRASVASSPWAASLADRLAEKIHQAARMQLNQRFHRLTQELHRAADDLRFHYDPDSLSPNERRQTRRRVRPPMGNATRTCSPIPAMRGR